MQASPIKQGNAVAVSSQQQHSPRRASQAFAYCLFRLRWCHARARAVVKEPSVWSGRLSMGGVANHLSQGGREGRDYYKDLHKCVKVPPDFIELLCCCYDRLFTGERAFV